MARPANACKHCTSPGAQSTRQANSAVGDPSTSAHAQRGAHKHTKPRVAARAGEIHDKRKYVYHALSIRTECHTSRRMHGDTRLTVDGPRRTSTPLRWFMLPASHASQSSSIMCNWLGQLHHARARTAPAPVPVPVHRAPDRKRARWVIQVQRNACTQSRGVTARAAQIHSV